jgi:signal transduction histidine kinase/CheY-like chemotaxis protein/ligand-binding sensor domain-containing protein
MNGAYALRGLDFDKEGRLWAAAVGEIGWFDQKAGDTSWVYHSLTHYLPSEHAILGEVWQVFAEKNGAVFISADKIIRWDGKDMRIWPMPNVVARRLHAMRVGNTIYVHHRATGLYALTETGPHLVIPASVFGDAIIFWMEPRPNGWLLATSQGLFTCEQNHLQPFSPETSEFLTRQKLTSALRLSDGRLALGTLNGGIMLVWPDGTIDRVLNQNDGLPTSEVFSLFVDRDNRLWATSNSNIFNVAVPSSSTVFDLRSGLPNQPVFNVLRDHGKLVAATDNNAYELVPNERRFQQIEGLTGQLRDLEPTADGVIVAATYGVKKVSSHAISVFYASSQDTFVAKPSRLSSGSYIISEGRDVVFLNSRGQPRVLTRNLPDIVISIAEDNSGRLWFGTTTRGVFFATSNSTSAVEAVRGDPADGLPVFDGKGFVVGAADGSVLVFSATGGWVMGRDARTFEPIAGPPLRGVVATSDVSADGTMWVAYVASENAPACLARITIHGNHASWQPHSAEGLWSIGAPRSILAEPAGADSTVLWIGGTKGLLRHLVEHGPVAPQPRAPLLHAFARSVREDAPQPITRALPYSTRAVLFEFAAPDFALRPALRLETRIDGIDDRWIPADPSSRRELTAVRDGRYTFRVRTVAETGVTSDETSFHFEILPPWWRTAPALGGLLLALVPAGYGLYRLRVRALRRHNAELERKVSQRTEQLEQASAAKTQFVANMSHDIRNPLNGIVGLALALENTRLDPRQRELVATLRECTTYLSTLVDDVLDFASIEAGRVELRPGPFTPGELLGSVVTMLKADSAVSGASLAVDVAPDAALPLLGDAGRIQQILVNYVGNALKYAGGQIRLSASVPDGSPGEIEFAVSDEGAGISEQDQATLFTKFTRLSGAQRSEIPGSGLGLASCRLLADLMGGSVGVTSRPGQGARFFLRLPMVAASAPVEPARLAVANTSVLLVEDADYNAWAASAVLAKLGLTCERARTGAEALRLFDAKRFNLVLLDRNLPDMDGTEVARQIRALEADGPRAILLAVTAYCTPQDRALCLDAGMDAFVGKPLTPEKLRKILIVAGRRLLTAASMHVSPSAAVPVLDVSLLDYMSDGTEQGLENQVGCFLTALAEGESRLTKAYQARDFDALAYAAHYLLSHAKLVGSTGLEEASMQLEQAARAQDRAAFVGLLHRVHREVRTLTEAMRRFRPEEQPA